MLDIRFLGTAFYCVRYGPPPYYLQIIQNEPSAFAFQLPKAMQEMYSSKSFEKQGQYFRQGLTKPPSRPKQESSSSPEAFHKNLQAFPAHHSRERFL